MTSCYDMATLILRMGPSVITPSAGQSQQTGADLLYVRNQSPVMTTDLADDVSMRLLAEGVSLSLLWDLVDPDGPASEDLLRHEN